MEPIIEKSYQLSLEVKGGKPFLCLDIEELSFSVIKSLKISTQKVADYARTEGYELVFAHTTDEKITRLWERVYPFDDIVQVSPSDWVCCWEVEKE